MATVIIIGFVFFVILGIVIAAYLADKKLRNIDKEKYYDKSMKKKLKKGIISDYEYENKNKVIRP